MHKSVLYSFSLIFIVICNCSQQLSTVTLPQNIPKEITTLLGKWEETSVAIIKNSTKNSVTDYSNRLNKGDRDDIIAFHKSGLFTLEEGSLKETTKDPQVYQKGMWIYTESTKELKLVNDFSETIYKILYLTQDSLVLE